jgi:hypothetical protein
MWIFDSDYNKWVKKDDRLKKTDFDYLQQQLSSVRFYSKALSGSTYIPVNDLDNIYDIIGEQKPKSWYISVPGSQYSNTLIPSKNPTEISSESSYDYYTRYLSEYGFSLKNLFTPNRLIKDSINNYLYVDVATTTQLNNIGQNVVNFMIDDIRVQEGHRVLVKNQVTNIVLPSSINPDDFFKGNYYTTENNLGGTIEYKYFNEQNGIYLFNNGKLLKQSDLADYDVCKRYSVCVKLGTENKEKQFHIQRLLNGYFPNTSNGDPVEFKEKKNWMLRNRVDYNNLFEINYFDILKSTTQSYVLDGLTYDIPERIISVGEFGVILNHQEGVSNVIKNKYKVNLRSISQTNQYYWICGDSGTLLKVRKHDFNIEKISLELDNDFSISLKSISFYDDLRGVSVGDLNTIYLTINGGYEWKRLRVPDFDSYYFNKVIFAKQNIFYISGNTGVFIEMKESLNGWTAFKRRISKFIDDEDEYLLVDNINDMYYSNINTWSLSFSYFTQSIPSDKEILFLVTDDSKIIAYDINKVNGNFDFIYLDFDKDYDDILNISKRSGSDTFYFTGIDMSSNNSGLFSFDINYFTSIGVGNSYSNTIISSTYATYESSYYPNEIIDYNGDEILICGNESLLYSSTYSTNFNFEVFDETFEKRLKSKLLFLDYDAGSKLNFFTDFGDYRLPNSVTFSHYATNSWINFDSLTYGATAPSYMTQSETNWFTYWSDKQKTFEFYSDSPKSELNKVVMSSNFTYSSIQSRLTISTITSSASQISYLAPRINHTEDGRFFRSSNPLITEPIVSFDVYLQDYLMVIKVSNTYPSSVGDVIRFESNLITDNFIINRIEIFGSNKYLYVFTEFNENIIKNLTSSTASVVNLNKYSTSEEFVERFNSHPISNGYLSSISNDVVNIEPLFNYLTSYYNLATSIDYSGSFYTMSYTKGFLNFGYSPTYNLLDYLESINDEGDPSPSFYYDKEYYSMPDYRGIPLQGISGLTISNCYIDNNGITFSSVDPATPFSTSNKLILGSDFKLEWESIFINTFVDINLYESSTYGGIPSSTTTKLLVTKKYTIENFQDLGMDVYVVEFHKKLNWTSLPSPNLYFIDIISRRKLGQISEDLQELNNIHRSKYLKQELNNSGSGLVTNGYEYYTYERELNFKISTDSYCKILLSDSETFESITGLIYIDNKNELSFNITKLNQEVSVPILNTGNFSNNLFIFCSEKHGLKTGDGVNLEFNGGEGSSQFLNRDYVGYHPVVVVSEYNFYINHPYGNIPLVGNDTGYVTYTKTDPFFNYQPVDLIDIGVDKRGKQSIELNTENLVLNGTQFKLSNIDFSRFRFRLIDGLTLESLSRKYQWILEAEISDAIIGENSGGIIWYKGVWESGRWFGGRWVSGSWITGDWYDGIWDSRFINDEKISVNVDEKTKSSLSSKWYGGRWFNGAWNDGLWVNGRWYDGTWNDGTWFKGIWNDGTWNNGTFKGGIWVLGEWNNGTFNSDTEPSYWLDGKWFGGDFENGMWYNGLFDERNGIRSRFGVNSYNSRTSTWHGGKWSSGSFHSRLNINDQNQYDVSDIHKYSIWYTGQWLDGDFYGGIAYNMDFKSGTWHGGILEDIQVIGFTGSTTTSENYFTLNGIFKFNIGDEFTIIDNQTGGIYANQYGQNDSPITYTVLYTIEDTLNKWTKVYVDKLIPIWLTPPQDTKLRVVSRFRNCNWKSGIWTNGIYEKGTWEGGIWYNGVFEATWM